MRQYPALTDNAFIDFLCLISICLLIVVEFSISCTCSFTLFWTLFWTPSHNIYKFQDNIVMRLEIHHPLCGTMKNEGQNEGF